MPQVGYSVHLKFCEHTVEGPVSQYLMLSALSTSLQAANGRPLTSADIKAGLRGRQAELFWPDDNLWYMIEIQGHESGDTQVNIWPALHLCCFVRSVCAPIAQLISSLDPSCCLSQSTVLRLLVVVCRRISSTALARQRCWTFKRL